MLELSFYDVDDTRNDAAAPTPMSGCGKLPTSIAHNTNVYTVLTIGYVAYALAYMFDAVFRADYPSAHV